MTAVRVRDLAYRYPDGTPALSDVSFEIAAGARVALVGANGAGKSTLLWHLNGLLPARLPEPPAAPVTVYGVPLTRATVRDLRRRVGLLFQDPDDQLFCPTVAEDVAFGPAQLGLAGPPLDALVAHCLQQVGLAGFERRAPHRLSRGEKRRVCLAGVLACGAELLVFDEPSSDLDPKSRRDLITLLKTLPATQLIATHDLDLAVDLCPTVMILSHGRLVAHGETRALLSDEALMLTHHLEVPPILKGKS